MAERLTPDKSRKRPSGPPEKRGPSHGQLKGLTKVAAQKRSDSIDRGLRRVERGTPGQPARPAPAVHKPLKRSDTNG